MDTKQKILERGLYYMKQYGYTGRSFRSIADDLGIKHTSIHYHYPNKDYLVITILEQYIEVFFKKMSSGSLEDYFLVFEDIVTLQETCLCAVLTSNLGLLNNDMKELLVIFREKNISYLTSIKSKDISPIQARIIFTSIAGALSFGNIDQDSILMEVISHWRKTFS